MDDTGTEYTLKAYASDERCWRCETALWRLDPSASGAWKYYCPSCQHLTMTRAAAEQALRDLAVQSPTAIGVVVAWPYQLQSQPQKENDGGQSQ
jgi:hypothetical protein